MRTIVKRWVVRAAWLGGAVATLALLSQWHPMVVSPSAEHTQMVRDVFAAYAKDHGHDAKCLDELVQKGYLKSIPQDLPPIVKDLIPEHFR